MFYSIMTPDGVQSVMSIRDFEDIARQYISDDYADAVRDTIYTAVAEKEDAVEQAFCDLDETKNIYAELDSLCGDIMSELNDLIKAIRESTTPTKATLLPQQTVLNKLDIADKLDSLVDKLYQR